MFELNNISYEKTYILYGSDYGVMFDGNRTETKF